MAVENHEVHEKVKQKDGARYGCWNLPRERKEYRVAIRLYDANGSYVGTGTQAIPSVMSGLCRNTGWYSKDGNGSYSWKEDPNAKGATTGTKITPTSAKCAAWLNKKCSKQDCVCKCALSDLLA